MLAAAVYFPLFLHLDMVNLYLWDEGRNAVHAYEMAENGNYFVRHFMGNPDKWETKPPILTWCQVICLKTIGYNELAIRMPAALAALALIILIFRFFYKELDDWYGGLTAVMVLITSMGFIRGHVARSGDHDSVLLFFLVVSMLYYYKYLNTFSKKHALVFGFALTGAVLTKSIAGLFFLPGLFLYTIYKKKLIEVFTTRYTYWAIGIFIAFVGGYYLIAESQHPGYLAAVWDNEFLPRFLNQSDNYSYNQFGKWYYTTELQREQFTFYTWLIPISLIALLFLFKSARRDFYWLLFFTGAVFFFAISMGTNNSWYSAPVIPLLAMIVGSFIALVLKIVIEQLNFTGWKEQAMYLFFFVSIFFIPYQTILHEQVYFPKVFGEYERYGGAMKKVQKVYPELKEYWVYHSIANAQFHFYQHVFNGKLGFNIKNCGVTTIDKCDKQLNVGEKVLVCERYLMEEVRERYVLKDLAGHEGCMFFEIQGLKQPSVETKE